MDLPSAELRAPAPGFDLVASIPHDAAVAAVFGRAKDFDALAHRQSLEYLWLSGIRDREAAIVGGMTWLRHLVVHDLRVSTLQAFAPLARLTSLRIAGSSKIKSLDGLERMTGLTELILFDCCNYATIEQVAPLVSLETLCLEGGVSKPLTIESLAPLARLTKLRRLRLASIRVTDKSLRPLHGLDRLRDVFVAKMFPVSELRAAAAALPAAHGEYLDSYRATS
jgi:hypothetical protein